MTLEEKSSTVIAAVNQPAVLSDSRDQIINDMKEQIRTDPVAVLYPVRSNDSSASSSRKSGSDARNMDDTIKDIKPNNPASNPVCKNCYTSTTPLWRRDEHGSVLCNACGLFLKLHGRPRPISLKTDVIKSRNRKSSHHDSPNDKKRKDPALLTPNSSTKKKKNNAYNMNNDIVTQNDNAHQNHQAQTSQQFPQPLTPQVSWQSQNVELSEDMKFHKILPKNNQGKGNPLPHLSNILSVSSATPMTGDFPTPNSPRLSHLHRPPPHLATINEILSNSNAQHMSQTSPPAQFSQSTVGKPLDNSSSNHQQQQGTQLPSIMSNHSQQSLQNTAVLPPAQLPLQQQPQPQLSQPLLMQQESKSSYFSTSPPPLELQHTVAHSTSSSSSNLHFNSQSQQQSVRQQPQQNQRPQESAASNQCTQSSANVTLSNDILNNSHPPTSPVIKEESKPSVSLILQSQEEVIKLKTRISELELVTDLYKRHVFELDSRCKALEQELLSVHRQQQKQ